MFFVAVLGCHIARHTLQTWRLSNLCLPQRGQVKLLEMRLGVLVLIHSISLGEELVLIRRVILVGAAWFHYIWGKLDSLLVVSRYLEVKMGMFRIRCRLLDKLLLQ